MSKKHKRNGNKISESSGSKRDYEIGFGKPPTQTQFRPGKSGNPKGRPKDSRNLRTIINDILDRSVPITENGRTRNVKVMEAFAQRLVAKALNGSTRDQILLFKMFGELAPEHLKDNSPPSRMTVQFVLPNGKTVQDYGYDDDGNPLPRETLDNDENASPALEHFDPSNDEDDS